MSVRIELYNSELKESIKVHSVKLVLDLVYLYSSWRGNTISYGQVSEKRIRNIVESYYKIDPSKEKEWKWR